MYLVEVRVECGHFHWTELPCGPYNGTNWVNTVSYTFSLHMCIVQESPSPVAGLHYVLAPYGNVIWFEGRLRLVASKYSVYAFDSIFE